MARLDLNVKNLTILIHFMEGLNTDKFDMDEFFHDCGTPSCALGWATTIPALQAQGLDSAKPLRNEAVVFGEDAYNCFFNGLRNGHLKTPQEWAEHARAVLRGQGYDVPPKRDGFKRFMDAALKPIPEATPDFIGYVERFPQ